MTMNCPGRGGWSWISSIAYKGAVVPQKISSVVARSRSLARVWRRMLSLRPMRRGFTPRSTIQRELPPKK
jgi:hypothetical protein